MAKPIYFSLLLLVLCLIYETYGYHRVVRHKRLPHKTYTSSSSTTTGAETNEVVTDTEEISEPATISDSAATSLSPSSSLSKSFSLKNALGYERNPRLSQGSKSRSGKYYGQQSDDMDSDEVNNGQIQNSMSSRFLSNKPQSGSYYKNNGLDRLNSMTPRVIKNKSLNGQYNINNQNDKTLEGLNIRKRQNSFTSDFQDFPNSSRTKTIPLKRHIVRHKTLPSSSNEDNSQQINNGNDDSSMMNILNSLKHPSNEQRIMFKSVRRCCINGECRVLKDGEECSIDDYFKNMKSIQRPNSQMFTTFSNGDNDPNNMMSKFNSFGQSSFNNMGGDMRDFQKTGKPTNMRMSSMRYMSKIPSISSSNGMGLGPYIMSQKRKPINYPHSDPIGLSENEADEIRNQVLQKSNMYRGKYNLEPFTLDDQLNNCAQDWANQMVDLEIFDHRKDNVYGENLFQSLDFDRLGEKAVESWYDEIIKFNIDGTEDELVNNIATHHMTQLLWKSSTKMGVGVSKNANGTYNVVADYDPVGNVQGFFKENLPEIQKEDIEEVIESHNSQTELKQEPTSWSSSSVSPSQPEWNYETFY